MKNLKQVIFLFILVITQSLVLAQNGTTTSPIDLSGTVHDSHGNPLVGAVVVVQGTTTGTTTTFDGTFQITASVVDPILDIVYVGYDTQSIVVGSRTHFDITLAENTTELDEVVVVGYGVMKKKLTTGANLNVKGDDISKLNTTTAMEALMGTAPGVSVQLNNGDPGAGTKVIIRGAGTIGDAEPLYIVDGMAVGNIDNLNPADIESIDVLKDAASAAIYGSRAANGVVLVTTKRGGYNSKTQVTYNGYFGVQNMANAPEMLNAVQYMDMIDEGRVNDGLDPYDWNSVLTNNAWLNEMEAGLGTKYGEEILSKLNSGWTGTDWLSEVVRKNAPVYNHNLSIRGGSENVTYLLGASYYDQTGMIGGSNDLAQAGYKRITTRLNTEMILLKRGDRNILKFGENFSYTNTVRKSVATGNQYSNDLRHTMQAIPVALAYWDEAPNEMGFAPNLEGITSTHANPLYALYYNRNRFSDGGTNNILGNIYLTLEPIENLTIRTQLGINSTFGNSRKYTPQTTGLDSKETGNINDEVTMSMNQASNFTWTNTATYDFDIEDKHFFSVLVGQEATWTTLNMSLSGSKINSIFGDFEHAYLNNTVAATNVSDIDLSGVDWAATGGGLLSYMARVSYNFDDKYMIDATMRADGSSNFAPGHQWGYFPSVSAGWNFSEEDFMIDNGIIDYGKFRASWGRNGNQSLVTSSGTTASFVYLSNITYPDFGYNLGGNKLTSATAAYPANVVNEDLTWETSEQLNFGLDLRFFRSRLSATLDWYNKQTKDWLVEAPILGTAGASAPLINGGVVRNRGFEFSLGWNDRAGEFKYGANISVAKNKNEVMEINSASGVITGQSNIINREAYVSRVEVGKPIGFFYGLETDGILQNESEVDAYVGPDGAPYFDDAQPGDLRFVDQDGNGVIDDDDKVMIGDPNPDVQLGIQLNAEYKGFYANMTLSGKFGMQVINTYFMNLNSLQNMTVESLGRWHGEGTSTKLPRWSSGESNNTTYISDAYVYDADFLRLSNITIGYDLKRVLKRANWVSQAQVYVSASNLFTITGYEGLDPDVAYAGTEVSWSSGIDTGAYPQSRTIMIGTNLTF